MPRNFLHVSSQIRLATTCPRTGYNVAVTGPRRDDFPNNYVGDLVHTDRG
jgi:hypothetical protein